MRAPRTTLGVDVRSLALDTQIAAYLLDPAETRYALDELLDALRRRSSCPTGDGAAEGQLDFGGDARRRRRSRPARRALAVDRLVEPLLDGARRAGPARRSTTTIEVPLVRVLARMEHVGVGVDVAELRALNDELIAECERLRDADLARTPARSST